MKVFIERSKKSVDVMFKGKVVALLNKLEINAETVLVTRNNVLLTEEDMVKETDEIRILSVISGG